MIDYTFDRDEWNRLVARGFTPGRHEGDPDRRCVMEALAAVTGAGDTDFPPCVARPMAVLLQQGQDSGRLTTAQLADLALLTLGTATGRDEAILYAFADVAIREIVADALEDAGLVEQAGALRALRPVVDEATARVAAWAARVAAEAAEAAWAAEAEAEEEETGPEWATEAEAWWVAAEAAEAARRASYGDPARYLHYLTRLIDAGVRAARGEGP